MGEHLDQIIEQFTFDELLEMNDLDHNAVLEILFSMGYITDPPQPEANEEDNEEDN